MTSYCGPSGSDTIPLSKRAEVLNGQQFYHCNICRGNLIGSIKHSGVPMCCCYQEMELLQPNQAHLIDEHAIDAKVEGNMVLVSVADHTGQPHSMMGEHSIEWIYLHTQGNAQRKMIWPGMQPEAKFLMGKMQSAVLYAYCSEHGLWERALPIPLT